MNGTRAFQVRVTTAQKKIDLELIVKSNNAKISQED